MRWGSGIATRESGSIKLNQNLLLEIISFSILYNSTYIVGDAYALGQAVSQKWKESQ